MKKITYITLIIFFSLMPVSTRGFVELYPGMFQKGICFTTWQSDKYESASITDLLEEFKHIGADHVQIVVTWYQEKRDSTEINPSFKTPTDKSIIKMIRRARKSGYKVMLKPHVDLEDTENGVYWRANIGFYDDADTAKWFASYKKFLFKYAEIARNEKVDIFCIGSEFKMMSKETKYWKEIIKDLRAVYKGDLIYSSHWENYQYIGFWEDLDYVGIAAYFPLTDKDRPEYIDIESGWRIWKKNIDDFYEYIQKPVVFTEIGYPCSTFAAREPWNKKDGKPDTDIQAKCYEVFFTTFWDAEWLKGVYWWRVGPKGEKHGIPNFCPLGKPAFEVLKKYYLSSK